MILGVPPCRHCAHNVGQYSDTGCMDCLGGDLEFRRSHNHVSEPNRRINGLFLRVFYKPCKDSKEVHLYSNSQ